MSRPLLATHYHLSTTTYIFYAKLFRLDLVRHRPPEPIIRVSLGDLASGKFDGRCVTICGEASNAFFDEVAPAWTYLVLTDGEHSVYAPAHSRPS